MKPHWIVLSVVEKKLAVMSPALWRCSSVPGSIRAAAIVGDRLWLGSAAHWDGVDVGVEEPALWLGLVRRRMRYPGRRVDGSSAALSVL